MEAERYIPVPGDVLTAKDGERTFYPEDPVESAVGMFRSFTMPAGQPLLVVSVRTWGMCGDCHELILHLVELGKDPPRELFYQDNEYGMSRFFDLLK
jgi:hypothetical protein